jgi:outer membrane receptor protein involved in Fe transport
VFGTPTFVPDTVLYKNIIQYGIVVKPLPNLSVFFGQNSNFTANPIQNGTFLPPQQGMQREIGIKTDLIPGRVNIAASFFEISQLNNTVPAFPQTVPQSQVLIPGETSRGIDGDFTINFTKNLSLVGSFALFKAHVQEGAPFSLAPQPYDGKIHSTVPVNNVSERNFAAVIRYAFTDHTFKGLSVALASTTLAKRAITDNSNQIFYNYLPGYTLFNLIAAYETKTYKVQLNVDNLLDRYYWFSARSNQLIFPGTPINPRVNITYKF